MHICSPPKHVLVLGKQLLEDTIVPARKRVAQCLCGKFAQSFSLNIWKEDNLDVKNCDGVWLETNDAMF